MVNFDYTINIEKYEYSEIQILYTVFKEGKCLFEPQLTKIYHVEDYHHGPKILGQSVFNEQSIAITGVFPEKGTYLILEILAKRSNPKKLFIESQIEGDGNGYPLSSDDANNPYNAYFMQTFDGLRVIGWTALPLFCDHAELERG